MSSMSSALKNLVEATRTATRNMASPFKAKSLPRNLEQVGLSFSHLENETHAISNLKEEEEEIRWVKSILGWLMEVATTLIKSVTVHSHLLKAQQLEVTLKAEALTCLQNQVNKLEKECDEARQRGLKGNLIISSPNLASKPSLLFPQKIKDKVTNVERNESHMEACIRAIKLKTGVSVPEVDVYACHPISRRGAENNTIFVICFSNRNTGSAWDSICSGLLSGKNCKGESFTSANLYISFQLTSHRAALAKTARQALGSRGGLARCRIDANGKISVKHNNDTHNWVAVGDEDHLKTLIAEGKVRTPSLN